MARTDDREALLAKFQLLSSESQKLATELQKFERCDPEKFEQAKKQTQECRQSAVRWTDNLYELQSWIKKNTQIQQDQLEEQYPIFKDLDYPQ